MHIISNTSKGPVIIYRLGGGGGAGADPAYKSDRVTGSWATPKKSVVQNVLTTPPPPPPPIITNPL